jgi:hypothetical protein
MRGHSGFSFKTLPTLRLPVLSPALRGKPARAAVDRLARRATAHRARRARIHAATRCRCPRPSAMEFPGAWLSIRREVLLRSAAIPRYPLVGRSYKATDGAGELAILEEALDLLERSSFILRSLRSGDECRDPASAADDERTHEPWPAFEPRPQHTVRS